MDKLYKGKPYFLMDDLGGFYPPFKETPRSSFHMASMGMSTIQDALGRRSFGPHRFRPRSTDDGHSPGEALMFLGRR